MLVNLQLPSVVARLASYYTLNQVVSNIVVPQGSCSGGFTIPANHSTMGVPNADYVLYVAAGPTVGSNIAWAGGCATDVTGRIVVGRANFGPAFLDPPVLEENIKVALHEIHHALGFTIDMLNATGKAVPVTVRGKQTYQLTSSNVVTQARRYLGCPTLAGLELEDEGGSGVARSHWEKRIVADEFMTASLDSRATVSALTFAAMEDMGYYTPDYSKASPMWFGNNASCSFVTNVCNTTSGGSGKFFCFDTNQGCVSPMQTHYGACSTTTYGSPRPSYFQWFFGNPAKGSSLPFYDYCPIVQADSSGDCRLASSGTPDPIRGGYFGVGGRCFNTSGLLKNGYTLGNNPPVRCLETRCVGTKLQFWVGASAWYGCTSANQVVSVAGYQGSVTCPPDPTVICPAVMTATRGSSRSLTWSHNDGYSCSSWSASFSGARRRNVSTARSLSSRSGGGVGGTRGSGIIMTSTASRSLTRTVPPPPPQESAVKDTTVEREAGTSTSVVISSMAFVATTPVVTLQRMNSILATVTCITMDPMSRPSRIVNPSQSTLRLGTSSDSSTDVAVVPRRRMASDVLAPYWRLAWCWLLGQMILALTLCVLGCMIEVKCLASLK